MKPEVSERALGDGNVVIEPVATPPKVRRPAVRPCTGRKTPLRPSRRRPSTWAATSSLAPPPVPGGLGALEAALVAGLSALGMPVGAAASAVLIYRLLTYWLTIPVGWVSLRVAEGRGYV